MNVNVDLREVFIILPGGFGAIEEAFQLLTEMSIGQTNIRPVIFIGKDFYHSLFEITKVQVEEEMLSLEVVEVIYLAETTEAALTLLGELKHEQII
ncbi:LOG family protein [Lactococcus kimchii]|uniref:LOG family protein n=1 Tax=Lactococcus sp. S-13 TaxID=2507158 RepID=UPI001CC1DC10|nr:LOG family protein [Lactococcus sp. S-13]